MTTRPRRKRKEEIMKAEVESIASKLNMTDDSSHGIKIAAIENRGRGKFLFFLSVFIITFSLL